MREKRLKDREFAKRQSESARRWQKENPIRSALNLYRGSASRKGLEFSLSQERFEALLMGECAYCGALPAPINGIDRRDSSLGYVDGNVATACKTCNYAKQRMTVAEFRAWARRVVEHME
jgi:hypothetical protein